MDTKIKSIIFFSLRIGTMAIGADQLIEDISVLTDAVTISQEVLEPIFHDYSHLGSKLQEIGIFVVQAVTGVHFILCVLLIVGAMQVLSKKAKYILPWLRVSTGMIGLNVMTLLGSMPFDFDVDLDGIPLQAMVWISVVVESLVTGVVYGFYRSVENEH